MSRTKIKSLQKEIQELRTIVRELLAENIELKKQINDLKDQLNRNSSNSNLPPSSDSPFEKPGADKSTSEEGEKPIDETASTEKPLKRKAGGQPGHSGHSQKLMTATHELELHPQQCFCGNTNIQEIKIYHTHQQIELPPIPMEVRHFQLYKGKCNVFKKTVKAKLPQHLSTGYGPRFTDLIGELSGSMRLSRTQVSRFCASLLNVTISVGAVQKLIDRNSRALEPHHQQIAQMVRSKPFCHVDETSWFQQGLLSWVWVMVHPTVAYYQIDPHRSKQALLNLIGDWNGMLVSDDYNAYTHWYRRQPCLDHLKRKAKSFTESTDIKKALSGQQIETVLHQIYEWNKIPPSDRELKNVLNKLHRWIQTHLNAGGELAKYARCLDRIGLRLFSFLWEEGVSPTNNLAERSLRFLVLWRKMQMGTQSEKGNRWIERFASYFMTCRLKNENIFTRLVEANTAFFNQVQPELTWLNA